MWLSLGVIVAIFVILSSALGSARDVRICVLLVVLAVQVRATGLMRADEHPGHGSKVVLGTLKHVTAAAIVVEVLDPGRGGIIRVRIELQRDTRFRIDKERLTAIDDMVGQRAIVSVDWEDDGRGGQTLTATEVRFTRTKKK